MTKESKQIKFGIIGYGFRIRHIANLMKEHGNVSVISICDTNLDEAKLNAKEN